MAHASLNHESAPTGILSNLGLRLCAIAVFILGTCILAAKPPFLRVFQDKYKVAPSSKLGQLRCLTCHEQPGPPALNPYGVQVQGALKAANARMVTPEILASVEKKDTGDGVPNIDKIHDGDPPAVLRAKPVARHGSTAKATPAAHAKAKAHKVRRHRHSRRAKKTSAK